MKTLNLRKESHYRNFVLHLPIPEEEYYAVLDCRKLFRECLNRIYRERPGLFPDGFGEGFRLKDKLISRYYGICIRSIGLLSSDKRIFSILPTFIRVDFDVPHANPTRTPKEIIHSIVTKEADGCSLVESDFRRNHPELYFAAIKAYGTWKLILETAGLSSRKAKSLCQLVDRNISARR